MTWTWRDNADLDEDEMERREPAIKVIADRICRIKYDREQTMFLKMGDDENGRDPRSDLWEDVNDSEGEEAADAAVEAYDTKQAALRSVEDIELRALEEALNKLGARMMRPYEHWNEDERLMQYLEGE